MRGLNHGRVSFCMNNRASLIQISFLMLFIELALIRWSSANIMFLFNVSNFVLLGSFLGMGMGFFRKKTATRLFPYAPLVLALIVAGCYYFSYEYQVKVSALTDNIVFNDRYFVNHLYPEFVSIPIVFAAVTWLMVCIADEAARYFRLFAPLQAYRYETLGSLCGIIIFSALAFINPAPVYWGLIITALFLMLLVKQRVSSYLLITLQIISLIVINYCFIRQSYMPAQHWSAYYKIHTQLFSKGRYVVNVNGFPQQVIESFQQREQVKPFYTLPYQYRTLKSPLNNVLVIGAGTGGDVAIALDKGAKHVDAVEIDPQLYYLGTKLNPNKPYADPRVTVYINDGRAFLQENHTQYDMIIFALADSLMLLTGQSSLRLENYLYTLEAMQTVKSHLTSQGVFVIYNYYGISWIAQRLANTMTRVFAHPPCFTSYNVTDYRATVLAVSGSDIALTCPYTWKLNEKTVIKPISDNRPFLYMPTNQLPMVYWVILLLITLVTLLCLKLASIRLHSLFAHLDFFLMGAAFLLLETKNIINFALLFGTTWFVNALVFIGVISSVYLAVEVTHRNKSLKKRYLYLLLFLSLCIAWYVPSSMLLTFSLLPRFILSSVIAFSPIFVANLIFADRFQHIEQSQEAFGANLIGAVIGGILEYSSLVLGYQNLLLLIMGIYFFAMICEPKRRLALGNS